MSTRPSRATGPRARELSVTVRAYLPLRSVARLATAHFRRSLSPGMAAKPEEKSSNAAFGGSLKKFAAKSSALGGLETNLNVFVPETQSPVCPRRIDIALSFSRCRCSTTWPA